MLNLDELLTLRQLCLLRYAIRSEELPRRLLTASLNANSIFDDVLLLAS